MVRHIISCALSPNTDAADVRRAWRTFAAPWRWSQGSALELVRRWFSRRYKTGNVYLFQSGRIAMWALLRAMGIGKGDEVIVQAFSCVAVSNSVRWAGATPVYADIDRTLNLDPNDCEKKITPRTKAIVLQHTFGIPADMEAFVSLAKRKNVLLIEDCAHAIGAAHKGKKLGSFGDAAFFSFGRDKAVSSVWGGAAIIPEHSRVTGAAEKLASIHASLPFPSFFWIAQQLLHPISFALILPTYTMTIGKVILVVLQKLRLLSVPVYPEEMRGDMPPGMATRYPNALAELLLVQLGKLDALVHTRRNAARLYDASLPKRYRRVPAPAGASYLRYPAQVSDPDSVIRSAKKSGILLGNWYHHVIDPKQVQFPAIGYEPGSCPKAEGAAKQIVNFPTTISQKNANHIVHILP